MEHIHRKVGLSQCGNCDMSERQIAAYVEGGIEAIEISCAFELDGQGDLAAMRRNADIAGLELWSAHLPFVPMHRINVASRDHLMRKFTVSHLSEIIRMYGEIGIKTFVVHPSAEPNADSERPEMLECAGDSLAQLAAVAASCGAVIAVENLPRTCIGRDSGDILKLLSYDDRLTVCFDTNHLLKQPISDFVRAVGPKIRTIHVSDYDFIDERHWLPGEGDIDWGELLDLLDEFDYRGPFLYELGLKNPRAPLVRARDLTYADFARNARELEAREKPTTLYLSR